MPNEREYCKKLLDLLQVKGSHTLEIPKEHVESVVTQVGCFNQKNVTVSMPLVFWRRGGCVQIKEV